MPKVRAGLTLARGEALDKSERREVTRAGTSCRRDFVRRQLDAGPMAKFRLQFILKPKTDHSAGGANQITFPLESFTNAPPPSVLE